MGKLKLKIFPDPILEKECDEIEKIDKNIIKLSQDMIETMIDSDGIGLSAPQVGILKRIFVCKDFSDEVKIWKLELWKRCKNYENNLLNQIFKKL